MNPDESLYIPAVDILPPSQHGTMYVKLEWMHVDLVFKIPDSGPYEESHQDMIKNATIGVDENIKWSVTRSYGCLKDDPNQENLENKLIRISFNAKYDGLPQLTEWVEEFTQKITSLKDAIGPNTKETMAHLFFSVPDEGKAYTDDEVKLIRQASSGHSWTVSRSYNSDLGRKTLAFKIYFNYKIAKEAEEKFPGLEAFATILAAFLGKFEIKSGEISERNSIRNNSEENLCNNSEEKYTYQVLPCPPRHTRITQLSAQEWSRSNSPGLSKGNSFDSAGRHSPCSFRYMELLEVPNKSLILEKLMDLKKSSREREPWTAEDALSFNITLKFSRKDFFEDY